MSSSEVAALPTSSFRDAPQARGAFPVAVIEGDASIANRSVLAEYLATHGWIVVVSASRTAASLPLEASEPRLAIETGVRGIEHAVHTAASLAGADPGRLVVIGVNFAGLAALEYQMREMRALALVTINGSETIGDRARALRESPWYDAPRVRVPVLNVHFDQPGAPPANRAYLESLHYAERRSLVVRGLDHAGLVGNPLVYPLATRARRVGYAFLVRSIHATLTRAVGGTMDDVLARPPEAGFPPDIVKALWERRALPAIPTRAEFAEVLWDRQDVASAVRLFRDARARDSTALPFRETDMGIFASRYQRLGRVDDGESVLRLALQGHPGSYVLRNDLGTLLLSRGDTAAALREYESALAIMRNATTLPAEERAEYARDWRARIERLRGSR